MYIYNTCNINKYVYNIHIHISYLSGKTKNKVSSLWLIQKIKSKENVTQIKNPQIFSFIIQD